MKSELHQATAKASLIGALRKKMNLALIRVAQLDLTDKRPEEISLGDVVGNLDAWGFLILFVSLVATLICSTLSGMLFLMIWPKPEPSTLVYLGAVPGVLAGFFARSAPILFQTTRSRTMDSKGSSPVSVHEQNQIVRLLWGIARFEGSRSSD